MKQQDLVVIASTGLVALAVIGLLATAPARDAAVASAPAFVTMTPMPLPFVIAFRPDGKHAVRANDKPMLVHIWATWCGPCRDELPALLALQHSELSVEALSVDESWALLDSYFSGRVPKEVALLDGRARHELDASVLPVSILVDKENRVVGRFQGARAWSQQDLNDAVLAADGDESVSTSDTRR